MLAKMDVFGHVMEMPQIKGQEINQLFGRIKMVNGLYNFIPDFTEAHNVPRTYFFNLRISRFSKSLSQNS